MIGSTSVIPFTTYIRAANVTKLRQTTKLGGQGGTVSRARLGMGVKTGT